MITARWLNQVYEYVDNYNHGKIPTNQLNSYCMIKSVIVGQFSKNTLLNFLHLPNHMISHERR